MKKPSDSEIPDTCICGIDWHPWCKLHGTESEEFKKFEAEVAAMKEKAQ